jgi:hypothetical protein
LAVIYRESNLRAFAPNKQKRGDKLLSVGLGQEKVLHRLDYRTTLTPASPVPVQ